MGELIEVFAINMHDYEQLVLSSDLDDTIEIVRNHLAKAGSPAVTIDRREMDKDRFEHLADFDEYPEPTGEDVA